ncbi:hypothetical protein H257_12127 [Aphanomyces astaci]|uniref:DDE-1 domain-containing protein n=1 Tax=Aphanomyces astaci TaxID=112090 RepID=W4FZ57_APHAT|nr:hypothetical protein H257_12127 [Aphanomyces astaci]ETV72757.1 hypothetical protein H257_12127 [Aphanomyces astaci]|eukprot:XP_009837543.1 hypothetical protein H257_12127 [Aphanomyces astaci]
MAPVNASSAVTTRSPVTHGKTGVHESQPSWQANATAGMRPWAVRGAVSCCRSRTTSWPTCEPNEEHLRVFHLMRWVNTNHKEWLVQYLASKKNEAVAYQSFRSLMHRFADRHRFRHRVPCASKVNQKVLDDVWMGNPFHFWSTYSHYPRSQILDVDETGVYFDMPPGMTLVEIGNSSKCKKTTKYSERLTAVMMIRADGGTIDTSELPTYPPGHVYAVQESAWMDD